MDAHLCIIRRGGAEDSGHGVISRDQKSSKVHEEFSRNVEEDQEEVDPHESKEGIDLWNRCLLFKIVQGWILRELLQIPHQLYCTHSCIQWEDRVQSMGL